MVCLSQFVIDLNQTLSPKNMLEGSILYQLAVRHQAEQVDKQPLSFGVYYKNTLVALCHALEDCILASSTAPVMLAAFQQGKWYLQEAERYAALAERSRQVVIMAAADAGFHDHPTSQKSNVELVDLRSDDPVAQEWHLIILAPTYTAMVLCQELSAADYGPQGQPAEDRERKFYGFWTFEPELVLEAAKLAIAHVGRYNPDLQQRLTAQVKEIAESPSFATAAHATTPDRLGEVVSCVVDYLRTSEQNSGKLSTLSGENALDYNLVSNELQAFLRMAQLVDLADTTNPMAATEVAALAETMGQLLDLPAWQMQRLRLAGLLHRIAPLQETDNLLQEEGPCCPLVPGAQVLRTMPQLQAVAQIITHQSEWWNGTGQPAGLAGDAIPLESRILGLTADFQQRVVHWQKSQLENNHPAPSLEKGLASGLDECKQQQGDRWDPKLVEILALLVKGLQQGLSLPSIPPKFTAGIGLLDPHMEDHPVIYSLDNTGGAEVADTRAGGSHEY